MTRAADSDTGGGQAKPRQEFFEIRGPTGALPRVELTGRRMTLGRAPDVQICLVSDTISRYHAELFCDDFGRWWVHDLGSHNGTGVNGRRVDESVLRAGDTVEIGPFILRLCQPPSAGETAHSGIPNPVSVSDVQSGPIMTLTEGGVPKVAASHLSGLVAFGRQLTGVSDPHQRLCGLCRLMVSDEFGGWSAMIMRLRQDRPGEPPEIICGPETRPACRGWKPYVSRSVLEAVRRRGEPILASNALGAPVDVELSLPGSVMTLSALACPLSSDQQPMDLLYVALPPEYGTREWLALASLAVEEFQHVEMFWAAYKQAEANALIEQELARARQIQRRLVPQAVSVPGWDVALEFEPCRWVGGDYVDVVPMPDGRTLLTVADVCGKGLSAALVAVTVHSLIHACLRTDAGLTHTMRVLNEYLGEYLPENSFVTMLAAAVDSRSGEIECVNAGHPPLIIVSPRGEIRLCEAGAHLPLGISPTPIQSGRERVPDGHLMAMFTDGLIDLSGITGERVGLKQLGVHLGSACASVSGGESAARQVADRLKTFIRETLGGRLPADDCTFLLARRLP